ncbi:PRA1 family protein 3-like [Varroa jacobsoni]|nr:PRA1 family protein 3-like [Varroa jacobsoni]
MTTGVPSFRPIEEFVAATGRFEVPNIQNTDAWANKVLGNLLYFQANYLVVLLVFFVPLGIFYTFDFLVSLMSVAAIIGGLKLLETSQALVHTVTRGHPLLFLIVSLAGAYLIVIYVGNLAVYFCGVVIPLFAVFVHASLRSRFFRTKSISPQDRATAMASPMGIVLRQLGESFEQLTILN